MSTLILSVIVLKASITFSFNFVILVIRSPKFCLKDSSTPDPDLIESKNPVKLRQRFSRVAITFVRIPLKSTSLIDLIAFTIFSIPEATLINAIIATVPRILNALFKSVTSLLTIGRFLIELITAINFSFKDERTLAIT